MYYYETCTKILNIYIFTNQSHEYKLCSEFEVDTYFYIFDCKQYKCGFFMFKNLVSTSYISIILDFDIYFYVTSRIYV